MPTELPQGRYLSLAFRVSAEAGGQTKALLLRNRIFATEGGVRPDVLTFGPATDYPRQREKLRDQGQLVEGMRLLNVYEHFRENGWGDDRPTGETLEDLSAHVTREDRGVDGNVYRVIHRLPGEKRPIVDYVRYDGTPFLRMPAFSVNYKSWWRGRMQCVAEDGRTVVGEYETPGQWFRRWIRDLVGEERTFVFLDSRFLVPHVVPIRGRRFHVIYQMHNIHLGRPHRWDSPIGLVYKRALERIGGMDAMVALTGRQREDIAERFGHTSNLFVVPNPVAPPEPPATPVERDPQRAAVVARLEGQKRLWHAVEAFGKVVAELPGARLDIYGEGSERQRLEQAIERRDLHDAVTLHGYDPHARDALWSSSAFLMTSLFEGYPLSTLESMGRGCPVVSYDIKYGPREQIEHGVDGFLVEPENTEEFARRVIEILGSPELAQRMSTAAREHAERFGPGECVARWAELLETVVERKRHRTRLDAVELDLTRLRAVRGNPVGRLVRRAPDFELGPVGSNRAVELAGTLRVEGDGRKSGLEAVELTLAWVLVESGEIVDAPLSVKFDEESEEFRVSAIARLPEADAWLRLRLTWVNSSWQEELVRLEGGELSRPDEEGDEEEEEEEEVVDSDAPE
jgi:poly(glycerol-phosphate) alpha-glucosyltransferase